MECRLRTNFAAANLVGGSGTNQKSRLDNVCRLAVIGLDFVAYGKKYLIRILVLLPIKTMFYQK